ncbi:hypothetical protein J132_03978 [Termitomyces sp. J132]|nr:hypothetical protein J132_03978 [Termitomyces sp. J132]
MVGSSGIAKGEQQEKSHKMVKSEEDASDKEGTSNSNNDNNMPLASKQAASLTLVASEEVGEKGQDVEMRETTPLATVAEVEPLVSGGEVKNRQEVKEKVVEVEKDEESKKELGTWSSTPLCQVGNNELKWYNERAAEIERQFRRELERMREELLEVWARFAVAKWSLETVAGYWGNCQVFLAWQKANKIGKEDWEERKMEDVPSSNADLNS